MFWWYFDGTLTKGLYPVPYVRKFHSNPVMSRCGKYPDPAKKISACPDIPWALWFTFLAFMAIDPENKRHETFTLLAKTVENPAYFIHYATFETFVVSI